jgi:hypothetical protein
MQLNCDRSDNNATPFERGSIQERIFSKFWKADRIVVRPDALDIFLTKWKLNEDKNHYRAAKPRKSTIRTQS